MATRQPDSTIEDLIQKGEWEEARQAIQAELAEDPESHWLLTRLSTTYYEQGDYQRALEYVEKASKLAPSCPLVLWDYAGTLDMLGRKREAINLYLQLIDRKVKGVAEDECGEGTDWAMGLLADCVFRVGSCYEDLGNKRLAVQAYRAYLAAADFDIPSIYARETARMRLRRLVRKRQAVEQELRAAGKALAGVTEES